MSLSTVDGRVEAEYVLPPDTDDTPFGEYVENDDFDVAGATLHHRDGTFYLHLRVKTEVNEPEPPEHPSVLGVDLGIENLAVTSTGRFWSGGLLNHRRDTYERVRGGLQQTGTERFSPPATAKTSLYVHPESCVERAQRVRVSPKRCCSSVHRN